MGLSLLRPWLWPSIPLGLPSSCHSFEDSAPALPSSANEAVVSSGWLRHGVKFSKLVKGKTHSAPNPWLLGMGSSGKATEEQSCKDSCWRCCVGWSRDLSAAATVERVVALEPAQHVRGASSPGTAPTIRAAKGEPGCPVRTPRLWLPELFLQGSTGDQLSPHKGSGLHSGPSNPIPHGAWNDHLNQSISRPLPGMQDRDCVLFKAWSPPELKVPPHSPVPLAH